MRVPRSSSASPDGERSRVLQAVPPAPCCAVVQLRPQRARAYCGPAHRREWTLAAGPLPERVDLPVGGGREPYRLVRHPTTGEPALDHRGALVFVPARRESQVPPDPARGPRG